MHTLLRFARLLPVIALFAACWLVVLASAAVAQTGDPTTVPDVFDKAQVIALIGGVILPFAVALLTNAKATGILKSVVAVVCAGLLALGTYLTDTGGAATWRGALSVFVITIVVAAGSRVTVTGGADDALARRTARFGIG